MIALNRAINAMGEPFHKIPTDIFLDRMPSFRMKKNLVDSVLNF